MHPFTYFEKQKHHSLYVSSDANTQPHCVSTSISQDSFPSLKYDITAIVTPKWKISRMGNCSSLKGTSGECPNSIRVLTDSGVVLQFKGPKLAAEILTQYPGHGIFKQGQSSLPLPHQETLISGQYYLLPLRAEQMQDMGVIENLKDAEWVSENEEAEDVKRPSGAAAASDFVENLANGSALEALPWAGDGVWRVKLVIDTKQLEEILSEQGNTGALIETMRMVAATAGSAASTPRQSKSLWGGGGGWNWKPVFSNLFKVPTEKGMVIKHGC